MDIYGCKNTHYSCYHQIFFIRMNQTCPLDFSRDPVHISYSLQPIDNGGYRRKFFGTDSRI